jgi:hypothetical protein
MITLGEIGTDDPTEIQPCLTREKNLLGQTGQFQAWNEISFRFHVCSEILIKYILTSVITIEENDSFIVNHDEKK